MACATTIYTNLDTVMLGFMTTNVDVGYYNAAIKIKTILVSVVTSLGTVLLPRASYYIEQGYAEEFRKISKKALNFVILLSFPLVIYFVLFAKEGIYFLSGSAYAGAVFPMQLIMPTLILIGITNILGIQILIPQGREKIVLYSEIVGAIIDLIINWLLIPKLASAGAAIGTLIAEFSVLVVQYLALKKDINDMLISIHYLRIIIAVVIACIPAVFIKILAIGNFATLMISAIVFWGIYGVVLILTKESLVIELLSQVLNKIRKC